MTVSTWRFRRRFTYLHDLSGRTAFDGEDLPCSQKVNHALRKIRTRAARIINLTDTGVYECPSGEKGGAVML
jgi:hypothetical protein